MNWSVCRANSKKEKLINGQADARRADRTSIPYHTNQTAYQREHKVHTRDTLIRSVSVFVCSHQHKKKTTNNYPHVHIMYDMCHTSNCRLSFSRIHSPYAYVIVVDGARQSVRDVCPHFHFPCTTKRACVCLCLQKVYVIAEHTVGTDFYCSV